MKKLVRPFLRRRSGDRDLRGCRQPRNAHDVCCNGLASECIQSDAVDEGVGSCVSRCKYVILGIDDGGAIGTLQLDGAVDFFVEAGPDRGAHSNSEGRTGNCGGRCREVKGSGRTASEHCQRGYRRCQRPATQFGWPHPTESKIARLDLRSRAEAYEVGCVHFSLLYSVDGGKFVVVHSSRKVTTDSRSATVTLGGVILPIACKFQPSARKH